MALSRVLLAVLALSLSIVLGQPTNAYSGSGTLITNAAYNDMGEFNDFSGTVDGSRYNNMGSWNDFHNIDIQYSNSFGMHNDVFDMTMGSDNTVEDWNQLVQNSLFADGNQIGSSNIIAETGLRYDNVVGDGNVLFDSTIRDDNTIGDGNDLASSGVIDDNFLGMSNDVLDTVIIYSNVLGSGNLLYDDMINDTNTIGDGNQINGSALIRNEVHNNNIVVGSLLVGMDGTYVSPNEVRNQNTIEQSQLNYGNVVLDANQLVSDYLDAQNSIANSNSIFQSTFIYKNDVADGNVMIGVNLNTNNILRDDNTVFNVTMEDYNLVGDGNFFAGYDTLTSRNTIGSFDFVGTDTTIGSDVVIGDFVYIGYNVDIGDEVTILDGAYICNGTIVPRGVVVGVAEVYGCTCEETFVCRQVDANLWTLGTHSYSFHRGHFDQVSAHAAAKMLKGYLATVHSTWENDCIAQMLQAQGVQPKERTLIGYYRPVPTLAEWEWTDTQEPNCYNNFDFGEFNNAAPGEQCTVVYPDGGWNDEDCSGKRARYNIVVEYSEDFADAERMCSCEFTDKTCYDVKFNDNGQYMRYAGNSYFISAQSLTWEAAQKYADSVGGYLVTLHSESETFGIIDLIGYLDSDPKEPFWIGLGRSNQDEPFAWVTDEVATCPAGPYSLPWDANEPSWEINPDKPQKNCVVIFPGGGLSNSVCSRKNRFIVEVGSPKGNKLCSDCE